MQELAIYCNPSTILFTYHLVQKGEGDFYTSYNLHKAAYSTKFRVHTMKGGFMSEAVLVSLINGTTAIIVAVIALFKK